MSDWTITANPKTIKNELESFYSNLYSEENSGHWSSFLDNLKELPPLTEELHNLCEGKIGYNECFNIQFFNPFKKHKTPGNDRLTVEFYLAFWPLIGKHRRLRKLLFQIWRTLQFPKTGYNYTNGKKRKGQKTD